MVDVKGFETFSWYLLLGGSDLNKDVKIVAYFRIAKLCTRSMGKLSLKEWREKLMFKVFFGPCDGLLYTLVPKPLST